MTGPEAGEGAALVAFVEVMRRLRAECNWKAAQTHRSLARYLLEETYETLDAIDSGDPERLRDELGDLLLQIYFHAAIAAERGEFSIDDVAANLQAKMIRRNPHVFGTEEQRKHREELDPAAIDAAWQQIKRSEPRAAGSGGALAELPQHLPALLWAAKAVERGLLAPSGGAEQVLDEESLGEQLLALVAAAQAAGLDPESALRRTVRRRAGNEPDGCRTLRPATPSDD